MSRTVKTAAVLLCVALVSMVVFAQDRNTRRANNRKARAYWKRADSRRKKKKLDDAKKDYEKAAALWQANGNRTFTTVTEGMVTFCEKLGDLNIRKLADGTYTGTARGYSADITVEVRLLKGRVKTLKFTAQRESRPLRSLTIVPKAIIRKQTPSVDAVSGATVTSYAVMSATLNALEKAKPDDADE